MTFNENLREKWISSGIEQKELAAKAGFSLKTLENYIHENSVTMPSADKAFRLAKALGTTVEELFTAQAIQRKTKLTDIQYYELRKFTRVLEQLKSCDRQFVLRQALDTAEFLLKD
jgi:transcriptional regulator with XRE-family HTH domain